MAYINRQAFVVSEETHLTLKWVTENEEVLHFQEISPTPQKCVKPSEEKKIIGKCQLTFCRSLRLFPWNTTLNDRIPRVNSRLALYIPYANKAIETITSEQEHSSASYDPQSAPKLITTPFTEEELKIYRKYKMNHDKRGIALIFNHEHFTSKGLMNREGTEEDGKRLSNTMLSLGFEVRHYQDKTWSDIKDILCQGIV
ncbi:hypothetical protein J437_LFUL001292 [Ladona fulva]|uniref:Caspase family p20 domain-containing protein n=1 Tax=Ladona fulva TaxID=123851 RepID=A0A8K0NRN9_LADFU|nr:hypothetical protein J437_LFUL001292 [Ladona fulva]